MHQSSNDFAPAPASSEAVHLIDDAAGPGWRPLRIPLESAGYRVEVVDSVESFLAALPRVISGCVILHLRMPVGDDLRLLGQFRSRDVLLPTVVVVEHGDVMFAVQAMKAGAIDVIERPYTDGQMIKTVSAALAAGRLDLMLASRATEARACLSRLSRREHAVLRELVIGRPNKLVAEALEISIRTVEIHRANMMHKLGIGSLAQAVRLCIAAGLEY